MTAHVPTLALFVLMCTDRADSTSGYYNSYYYDYYYYYYLEPAELESSLFSEGACNENASCSDAALYNPPVGAQQRNPVSVSWVITDLDAMDETAGTISVNTDIQFWWMDCRWPRLVTDEGWRASEMRTMAGFAPLWYAAALGVSNAWDSCEYSPTNFWTPVPRALFPKTADNPVSITTRGLFIQNLNHEREGWNTALLLDEDPVQLTYRFDYTSYPFDEQVMDLVLQFDMYTSPSIATSIETSNGTESLSYISSRTTVTYEASTFSPHLAQTAVEAFLKKGWRITSAELENVATGNKLNLRFRIKLARLWKNMVVRFFVPLFLLATISFAAFFLPLSQVMPRVAVGFVSFLSLAVFRNQAYSMLPSIPSSLVWLDVAMLTITEIMWLAVVLNIVALVVNTFYSLHGARFVDKVVRIMAPLTSVIVLTVVFVAGHVKWTPVTAWYSAHVPLALSFVITSIIIGRYLWCLPSILLRTLAQELADKKLVWKDGVHLEPRDLALVFRYLDEDNSGVVTPDETIIAFEKAGLKFRSQEEREHFRRHVGRGSGAALEDGVDPNTEMDLDEFRGHFNNLLGGKLVRRLHRRFPRTSQPKLEQVVPVAPTVAAGG